MSYYYIALKSLILKLGISTSFMGLEIEPLIFGKLLDMGDTVIDVGANLGVYTSYFAMCVGEEGQVYAFEPFPQNAQVLRQATKLLGLKQVTVVEGALSNINNESIGFSLPVDGSGKVIHTEASLKINKTEVGSGSRYRQTKEIMIRAFSLDDFEINGKVSLIKIDVEGAELLALEGANQTIRQHRPIVICEIEGCWTERYDYQPEEIFNFFTCNDYEAFVCMVVASSIILQPCHASIPGASNYVFLPKERANSVPRRLKINSLMSLRSRTI